MFAEKPHEKNIGGRVAAAVVGSLAAVGIISIAVFFFRRRQAPTTGRSTRTGSLISPAMREPLMVDTEQEYTAQRNSISLPPLSMSPVNKAL